MPTLYFSFIIKISDLLFFKKSFWLWIFTGINMFAWFFWCWFWNVWYFPKIFFYFTAVDSLYFDFSLFEVLSLIPTNLELLFSFIFNSIMRIHLNLNDLFSPRVFHYCNKVVAHCFVLTDFHYKRCGDRTLKVSSRRPC